MRLILFLSLLLLVNPLRGMTIEPNSDYIESIKEKFKTIDFTKEITKEEAVIIVQSHLIDENYDLKEINFYKPFVEQNRGLNHSTLTEEDFKSKFINGKEIFDWLMQNGFFIEASGKEGQPRDISNDVEKILLKMYPKDGFRIYSILSVTHDCWTIIFNTSLQVRSKTGLKWLTVNIDKKTGKIISEGEGPS